MIKKRWLLVNLVIIFAIASFGNIASGSKEYIFYSGNLKGTATWNLWDNGHWPPSVFGTVTDSADVTGIAELQEYPLSLKWTTLHLKSGDTFMFHMWRGPHTSIPSEPIEDGSGQFWVRANLFKSILISNQMATFTVIINN